jgi:hypothetical protein
MTSKSLRIAPDLKLPLEAATQTFAILAVRGAGKSNTAVVLAEEFHKAGIHWIAIDPKGDWWGIQSAADGKSPGLEVTGIRFIRACPQTRSRMQRTRWRGHSGEERFTATPPGSSMADQDVDDWVVRFECGRCDRRLDFRTDEYVDPDGYTYTGIFIEPHTCALDPLIEVCTIGSYQEGTIVEDDLFDVLTTRASKAGWDPEEANQVIQRLRAEGRTDKTRAVIPAESHD